MLAVVLVLALVPLACADERPVRPADALEQFFAEVDVVVSSLRELAPAVHRNLHARRVDGDRNTARRAWRVDPHYLATDIPAGLNPELEAAVLRVYSELLAWADVLSFLSVEDSTSVEDFPWGDDPWGCWRYATRIADRLPGHLAEARQLASMGPSFPSPARDSQPAEALAARLSLIDYGWLPCGEDCGGPIYDRPWTVRFAREVIEGIGLADGRVKGSPFRATFTGGSWRVEWLLC